MEWNESQAHVKIKYDEQGRPGNIIIFSDSKGYGEIINFWDEARDTSLCPCCMYPETRNLINLALTELGIRTLRWESTCSEAVTEPEYGLCLQKTSKQHEFRVIC